MTIGTPISIAPSTHETISVDENLNKNNNNTGVEIHTQGVEEQKPGVEPNDTPSNEPTAPPTESKQIEAAEQDSRERATSTNTNERITWSKYRINDYTYLLNDPIYNDKNEFALLIDLMSTGDPTKMLKSMKHGSFDKILTLLSEQMSAKKGLKKFRNSGTAEQRLSERS